MIGGEQETCLFCGAQAERGPFSEDMEATGTAIGWKYECPNCGLYALPEEEHNWIENSCSEEEKIKLFEYLRDNPPEEGSYRVLTMDEIKKILHAPPPFEQF